MKGLRILDIAVVAAAAASPASAQTARSNAETANLESAFQQAKLARAQALEALNRANEAIAMLERAFAAPAPLPVTPVSATSIRAAETKRAPVPRPADMPACDAPGTTDSIGDYMLRTDDGHRQKKESSYDRNERGTNDGINAFVYHCLGLTRATDYESTTNLSAQFVGTKGSDQIEAAVTRISRAIRSSGDGSRVRGTYNKYSAGAFGRTGPSGDAPLIDLTETNFSSGFGLSFGFEWGRMPSADRAVTMNEIHTGIAKARAECKAAKEIEDPLTGKGSAPGSRPRIAMNPISSCEGDELVRWMSQPKAANRYWTDIVSPLWGYAKVPVQFAGATVRYAFQDVSYRPVIDRGTGSVIAPMLPDVIDIHPEPYAIKLYGGFNHPITYNGKMEATLGLTGSLTYRREVEFIDGTSGRTVCTPAMAGATYEICSTDQKLAAPYQTSGFVAGIAVNVQSRRFWYLPPIAVSPRFTYAFDTKRPGIEAPFFLLTDSDGKLNSGVKLTCRFKGRTREGFELKETCDVNLFVGTSFEIGKTP